MLLLSNGEEGIPELDYEYLGVYEVTAYASYEEGNDFTADGSIPSPYITVAASQEFPFGTKLYIEGVGEVVVQDRGAFPSHVIDLYIGHDDATAWGRKELKIWILQE